MSNIKEYSDKYKHNEDFVEYLNQTDKFPDWTIVGIFYSALHYMNLFLTKKYDVDINSISSHVKRNKFINDNCSENISRQYNILYNISRTARYQYIDVSNQLEFTRSCYKKLKEYCVAEIPRN